MTRSPPSLRLRQNANQSIRKESRKENKQKNSGSLQKKSTLSAATTDNDSVKLVFPGGDTAFKALLSARFCAAIWSHVTDCDETYNYWEPMHYLVFGKGLQTWEYSPEYALRSYTYILIHATPSFIYHKILQPNPLLIFYFVRCVLGFASAFAEVYFYKAVCREFGVNIGRLCLAFQLFSAGMFISTTAFLPSSWAMYMFSAAAAAWWHKKYPLAIFLVALAALLGWPFAALLGVPIVYDMLLVQKMYFDFFRWTGISALAVLGPMILLDSQHYGTFVIAPLNIVMYNVFGGGGPDLYGTEPFSYYLINGFLNFNIVWILALSTPLALVVAYFFVPSRSKSTLNLPHYLSLAPFFLWLAVFMMQPHKEERFLFPVYPYICLCGAITVDILQKLWFRIYCIFKKVPIGSHYLDYSLYIMLGAIFVSSILGISRIFSLYRNYHAPLDLMMELNRFPGEAKLPNDMTVNVCFGKDWHRYPSSFFLPNRNWNVRFVRSEFKGILPAPYSELENGTRIVHAHFNDRNREEPTLYFDVNKCHFMLDLDTGKETELEPVYAKQKDKWKVLKSLPFLIAEKSNSVLRAFYVPGLSDRFVHFGNFSLLQSTKFKRG